MIPDPAFSIKYLRLDIRGIRPTWLECAAAEHVVIVVVDSRR